MRRAKRDFWERKGAELEEQAKKNNTRAVYQTIKELSDNFTVQDDCVKHLDGTPVKDDGDLKERWRQHFEGLLNVGKELAEETLLKLDVQQQESDLEEPYPTEREITDAIKALKNNKAAGIDGIHAEMIKAGGTTLAKYLYQMFVEIWKAEKVPEDWVKAVV
ncbi:unnamed protein product, partial [Didymodactylos carnosus]